jgi:hypothetical protein
VLNGLGIPVLGRRAPNGHGQQHLCRRWTPFVADLREGWGRGTLPLKSGRGKQNKGGRQSGIRAKRGGKGRNEGDGGGEGVSEEEGWTAHRRTV